VCYTYDDDNNTFKLMYTLVIFTGVWFVHCHMEDHVARGLDMAFEVQNGPTPSTSLPPPPADLPKC